MKKMTKNEFLTRVASAEPQKLEQRKQFKRNTTHNHYYSCCGY